MKRIPAALMSALLAGSMPAQAPDNAVVLAAAQAFDDAQLHGDRAALERMLAPDFLFIRGSGRIGNRADFIAGFTMPNSHLAPFDIRDRLLLRLSPDMAVVGGEARIRGTEDDKPFAEHFRYSDMFALRSGRWVAVFTQVTGLP